MTLPKGFPFFKYHGTGNDFILADNRDQRWSTLSRAQIAALCDRRFGIGADGLILLESHPEYDFVMRNFNADGGECTMCGNGARTLVQFARDLGIQKDTYRFLGSDGPHEARVENDQIAILMKDVTQVTETPLGTWMDTGSPHLVIERPHLMTAEIVREGRNLRNSAMFMPGGVNVNFVEKFGDRLFVRTYERGVEDETLSCGTGVIAASLSLSTEPGLHRQQVQTRGGLLEVRFERLASRQFKQVWLVGPTQLVFKGSVPG